MLARIVRTSLFAILFAMTALLAGHAPAGAEGYPDRVVRIVSPYPPGGSVDVMARLLAQKLSEVLGGSFIVETRDGAGGNTGAESVAKYEPDGYTLLFTAPGPLVITPQAQEVVPLVVSPPLSLSKSDEYTVVMTGL